MTNKQITNKQIKNLQDRLWEGADQLRANSGLKLSEYAILILGLIFLRFAESKYAKFEAEIKADYEKNKGSRAELTALNAEAHEIEKKISDNLRLIAGGGSNE